MKNLLKEMLIGTILGDAHLGRTGLNRAFLTFEQSAKKSDYLNHIYNIINQENLALDEPKSYSRKDSRYNSKNQSLYFRTKSLEELKPFADLFLDKENNKTIPVNIANYLTPRSLAFWIMDDGQAVKRGGVTLCTDSFKSEQVSLLKQALENKFEITTSIHNKKGSTDNYYERIYIGKNSLDLLKPELKQHFHDSMLYKINEVVPYENSNQLDSELDSVSDSFDIGGI